MTRQAGFTLLEMIVVITILGLSLGLILSRGPVHSARADLRAGLAGVAGALRTARGQAIAADRPVVVSLDAAHGLLRVGAGAPRSLPPDISMEAPAAILFAPDGSSSGGLVTLASGSLRGAVAVDWLTGRVAAR